MLQDGLGSVCGIVDNNVEMLERTLYEPYGTPFGTSGTMQTIYGFTGEMTDANDLLYLRARYYAPNVGVFTALDPFEGMAQRPMSLNGYSWVEGNPINMVDPSGTCPAGYVDVAGNCAPIAIRESLCASNDLLEAKRYADPTRTEWNSGLELWLTQIKAQCVLENGGSSLEKLADLSDFVAGAYANDRLGYINLMSQVVIGTYAGAAVRSLQAGGCAGWGREPKDCPSNTQFLDDTGFHVDFRDGHNQVYHFWGMAASMGAMQNGVDFFYSTFLNFIGFQFFHEIVQGALCNAGAPLGDTGASWEDFASTDMAITFGIKISGGAIGPSQAGNWLRSNLGTGSRGWDLANTAFGRVFGLESPADLQALLALPGGRNAVCGHTGQTFAGTTC